MRVLFTTTPGWGHIHPMVPLARAFLDRGDEVVWATAADVCARLERDGFRTVAAGLGEEEARATFQERFPEIADLSPTQRPLFMFPRLFGAIRAAPMLAGLLPFFADWRPDLVVRDAAEFAGPVVAAVQGGPQCHPLLRRPPPCRASGRRERRGRASVGGPGAGAPPLRRQLRPPLPRHLPEEPPGP